ncbi:siderophore ABC transporter substrate-binding protein [Zhihengliuella halotolerans]|uniref:siderophore ABC transporter substrate-binding protein n=1 Tax=Zhihengliuella halotolerans TaxID=370736 RepID=UPI000C7FED13|nr:ABC transporter substrate-binding protein [Zhihengliuella halotolerans]
MKLSRTSASIGGLAAVALLGLTACGGSTDAAESGAGAPAETITVETNNGPVEVPADAERVVALDNTSFATLKALGVEPVAVPKQLLPKTGFEDWRDDEEIADVGTHREPDLEALNAAEPDLIVGGYRFSDYTDDLAKIAPVLDVTPDAETPGAWLDGLRTQTETLGTVFGAEEPAAEIVAEFDAAQTAAEDATDGETVFLANASAGKLDNGAGRIGRLLEGVDLEDVFASEDLDGESVHNDSGLAPETVAEADPDWMIVMDRDAAVSTAEDEFTPAQSLVAALENVWGETTFFAGDQIIYLDANFYVTEGIQAYTEAYEQIAEAFSAN